MKAIDELVDWLGAGTRLENTAANTGTETTTISGLAVIDSNDGSVDVIIGDEVIGADIADAPEGTEEQTTTVTVNTTAAVKEGDSVIITLVGNSTGAKEPTVTGVIGGGDRLSASIEAQRQYFFHDDEGAHVSTVPDDATTGPNMLATSAGVYLRDGETRMTGHTRNGFEVYNQDGDGSLASITKNGIKLNAAIFDEESGEWVLLPLFEFNEADGLNKGTPTGTIGTRSSFLIEDPEPFNGAYSFTIGEGLYAPMKDQVILGTWNAVPSAGDIFAIGAGDGPNMPNPQRRTVFTVNKNGMTTAKDLTSETIDTPSLTADEINAGVIEAEGITIGGEPVIPGGGGGDPVPVVLYNSAAGITSTITLSDSAANYEYMEIYYHDGSNSWDYTKVYKPNGKRVALSTQKFAGNAWASYCRTVDISGNKITTVNAGTDTEWHGREYQSTTGTSAATLNRNISIARVVGIPARATAATLELDDETTEETSQAMTMKED